MFGAGSVLPAIAMRRRFMCRLPTATSPWTGLVTNPLPPALHRVARAHWASTLFQAAAIGPTYGPGGWYLDAVVQGNLLNGKRDNAIRFAADQPAGFASSLEGGYPIPLPLGPRFVLEPQAPIIWQQVTFHEQNDGPWAPVGRGSDLRCHRTRAVRGLYGPHHQSTTGPGVAP